MSRHTTFIMATALLLVVQPFAAPGSAQSTSASFAPHGSVVQDSTTDPARSLRAARPHALLRLNPEVPKRPSPRDITTRGPEMMVVGGAANLVGAVIGGDGGDVLMLGGAVVGLIGLWNYLT